MITISNVNDDYVTEVDSSYCENHFALPQCEHCGDHGELKMVRDEDGGGLFLCIHCRERL